ncbi:MAG: response regulator [Bacteroidota bacterium]|nr:response regulator [Bacteroidota bacterium]
MQKILIIDDIQSDIEYLEYILKNEFPNIESLSTTDPEEGIKIAQQQLPNLILLDIVMPKMDGYKVCELLKNNKSTENISIIFITSSTSKKSDKIKALNIGGNAFITKPFDEIELNAQIKTLLKTNHTLIKLQESETTFKNLYNTSSEAIYIQNYKKEFIDVNQGVVDMFGYKKGEFIGKTPEFISAPNKNDFEKIDTFFDKALNGKPQQFKFWGKRKNGEIFLKLVKLSLSEYFGEKVILTFSSDITEQEKAEELLKKENNFKTTLISILSHDLRSPFNSILGFSDLIADAFDEFEEKEIIDMARNITKTSRNTLELITNLLEWSRIEANRYDTDPQKINLEKIINTEIELLESNILAKKITLSTKIINNTFAYADKKMISTVVRNLLSNAIKFTPIQGNINITIRTIGFITEFIIEDSGIGIKAKDVNKLFGKRLGFTTAGTNKEKGSGLGLVICKEFVEKNNGEITVESTFGKGSKFIVKLPIQYFD